MKRWPIYKASLFMISVLLAVISALYIKAVFVLPGELTLIEGEEYTYDFRTPFLVNVKADRDGIIKLDDDDVKTSGNLIDFSNPVLLQTQKNGIVNLSMKIFGLLPLPTVKVDIVANRSIVACGNTVGVKLKIDGILVIGISDVETIDRKIALPAKDSGLKPGDLIMQVNGSIPENIAGLVKMVEESNGKPVKLKCKSGDSYNIVEIKPVKAFDDNQYHLGIWVRDNTAGIGTLTFYDPLTGYFGALGHGITDIDTGTLMPVDTGEILESNILAVKKGKQGLPGELKGVFIEDKNKLGIINTNCNYGIYGKLNSSAVNSISNKLYPIGVRAQIEEGPATILANIMGKTVEEYAIEIIKVSRQSNNGLKGMIIKITDKRLLSLTGGIVQGMSGSPIIQNGRIIGAVTHVLVNDPTKGYGIFIECMLKNLDEINNLYEKKVS